MLKKLFFLGITLSCLYLAARGVDGKQFWTVLTTARSLYLLAAVPLLFVSYLVRALRCRYLLPAKLRGRDLLYLFPTMMIGYFANNSFPARAGDLARVLLIGRHEGLSRAQALSTVAMERAFDGLLLSVVGLLAIEQFPLDGLEWMKWIGFASCGLFLVILSFGFWGGPVKALLTWTSSRFPGHLPPIVTRQLHSVLDCLEKVTTATGLFCLTIFSAAVWILELGVYELVAESFGIWLSLPQLGLFVVAVNFASLVPTSPGGVGTIELVATEALVWSGVERETALAMVIAQHGLQYLFCLLLGLYYKNQLKFSMRAIPTVLRSRTFLDIDELIAVHGRMHETAVRYFQNAVPRNDLTISMVIPAYNEEERILPTLLSALEYFHRTGHSHEIIVVDDGSQDETASLVQQFRKRFPSITLIRLPHNMGKGAAVRTGIRNATGNFIIYNDADGSTPASEIERLLAAIEQGADVAIGSRALYCPETHVERNLGRAVAGRVFAALVNAWTVPGIADTQCGFKLFRHDVAKRIFDIQRLNGFAFDVEVLRIASVLGYRVAEVPVNWTHIGGSKVSVARDSLRMVYDVVRVRYIVPNSLGSINPAVYNSPAEPSRTGAETMPR